MNNRKSNLTEIARAAGVSKMTASRVLRDTGGFSEATRIRVMREAERLNYVPNRLAAAFGSDSSSTLIGVLVPRLSSGMFGQIVEAIDRTLTRLGYHTIIGTYENLTELEEKWLRSVLSWRPAGVMLTGRYHSDATDAMLRAAAIPLVEMWELNTRPVDLSVGVNHFDCGFEMGRLVLSKGHTRIGYVGAEADAPGMGHTRAEGFFSALAGSGIDTTRREMLNDKPGLYAGLYGARNLLARHPDLDVIYCQDDDMAIGALALCRQMGLRVPEDIGIAGWGGMDAASILDKRLTTTTIPASGLGKSAAEAIVGRIRDEPVQDVVEIKAQLVPGQTI